MAIRFPNRPNHLPAHHPISQSTLLSPVIDTPDLDEATTPYNGSQYNASQFYEWDGRVGRVQFVAYPLLGLCAVLLVLTLAMLAMGVSDLVATNALTKLSLTQSLAKVPSVLLGLCGVLSLMLAYLQVAVTKRRLNDLNKTGWLAMLLLIPVLGWVLWGYLLVKKGDLTTNRYGLPPLPPSQALILLTMLVPMLVIPGFGMIFAMPAYQSYGNITQASTMPTSSQPPKINTNADQTLTHAAASVPMTASNSAATAPILSPEAQVAAALQAAQATQSPPVSALPSVPAHMPLASTSTDSLSPAQSPQIPANPPLPPSDSNTASVLLAPSDAMPNLPTASDSENQPATSGISYEDFVKTAEAPVFIDR